MSDPFSDRILGRLLSRRAGQTAAGQQLIVAVLLLGDRLGVISLGTLWSMVALVVLISMVVASPIWIKNRRFYTPELRRVKCPTCESGYFRTVLARCDHCGSELKPGKAG